MRKALLLDQRATGTYDWSKMQAQWTGSIKKWRQPLALQSGEHGALLLNTAIMRDAQPGAVLHYRLVDAGRAREHGYQVASHPETMAVGDMSYDALRVERRQARRRDHPVGGLGRAHADPHPAAQGWTGHRPAPDRIPRSVIP